MPSREYLGDLKTSRSLLFAWENESDINKKKQNYLTNGLNFMYSIWLFSDQWLSNVSPETAASASPGNLL